VQKSLRNTEKTPAPSPGLQASINAGCFLKPRPRRPAHPSADPTNTANALSQALAQAQQAGNFPSLANTFGNAINSGGGAAAAKAIAQAYANVSLHPPPPARLSSRCLAGPGLG
jgi:hypothetical protein